MDRTPIIDCHTHCYPHEVVADPCAWATNKGEYHWRELVAPTDRKSIQGWSTPESMLSSMDAAEVDQAVLLGWYWENEATCRWHNEVMAEWASHAPERFIPYASIYPNENLIDQLQYAKSLGCRGVGELHMGVQQFDAAGQAWLDLAEWCVAHNWPVNLHVTEAAGHDHPGMIETPLREIVRMAEVAPKLKIILAHWGGGLPFFEQNPKIRDLLKNVYYDCAASPLLYDPSIFSRMVDLVGVEKILYGSDFPLRLYPRKQKTPDMKTFLKEIQEESALPKEAFEDISGRNFLKVAAQSIDSTPNGSKPHGI